ncbi:MAG: hypothetical protein JXA93_11395 [Anaerolineae bacterium]|nr:hypothetical protein [Anaerolineae bacterium]
MSQRQDGEADRGGSSPPPGQGSPEQAGIAIGIGERASVRDVRVAQGNIFIRTFLLFGGPLPVVAAVLSVSLVGALVAAGVWLVGQPARMRGDFNIAIAEFHEIQGGVDRNTDLSASITRRLCDYLETELQGFDLQVQVEKRNMPYIEDPAQAEELASRIGAHLVIYGTIVRLGDQVSLQPMFYVVPEIRGAKGRAAGIAGDVDEITSAHAMDFPLGFDPGQPEGIVSAVQSRASIISYFIQGLVWMTERKPELARACFGMAIDGAGQLDTFEGMEVLYLFSAVSGYQAGAYTAANADLDRAFEVAPGYGRAQIARANVYYHVAVEGFEELDGCLVPELDGETAALCASARKEDAWWYLVARAHEGYLQAAQAEPAPHEYRFCLAEKGWIGSGNVKLLLAQREPGLAWYYEQALEDYQRVVDSYLDTAAPARAAKGDRAAQAYWGIGVISERLDREADAVEAFRDCVQVAHYDEEVREECQSYLDQLLTPQESP